jgi:hypothetical protein
MTGKKKKYIYIYIYIDLQTLHIMTEKKSETLTWVPSLPARGESLTPKVIEMVGGSSSTVGNAVIT